MTYVSVDTVKKLRRHVLLWKLNALYPQPPRKVRRCHARKREVRLKEGRKHIRRVVQAEIERERKVMNVYMVTRKG